MWRKLLVKLGNWGSAYDKRLCPKNPYGGPHEYEVAHGGDYCTWCGKLDE